MGRECSRPGASACPLSLYQPRSLGGQLAWRFVSDYASLISGARLPFDRFASLANSLGLPVEIITAYLPAIQTGLSLASQEMNSHDPSQ